MIAALAAIVIAVIVLLPLLSFIRGFKLQAELNTRAPHLPVILTSGLDNPELELEACQLGTVTFLRKPFEPGALLGWIRKALGEETSPSRVAI